MPNHSTRPTDQAYEYKITRDFAGLTGNEIVYDLYTGTGTIAQFVSKKKVIGVVLINPGRQNNAVRNNIDNCEFYVGDMKLYLTMILSLNMDILMLSSQTHQEMVCTKT
jgi:tRNA/tmRNA/rRNA uracil-C5-methylase (TrmA/RlmC/RlmD family)